MRLLSALMLFEAAIVIYAVASEAFRERPVTAMLAIAMVGAAAIALNLEFFGVRILYDAEGIETRSPWRRRRRIPWEATRIVRYTPILKWYELKTVGHGTVRMHDYLAGRASLIEELENRGVVIDGVERPIER